MSTSFGAQWLGTGRDRAKGWKWAPGGTQRASGEVFSGGGEDVLGFFAGEFVAGAESVGEAVDGVQLGADQIVGALAQAAWAEYRRRKGSKE